MPLTSVLVMKIAFQRFDGALNPFFFFSSVVALKALVYSCPSCGKMVCYSLVILQHEIHFSKCFNDPRTRAAAVPHDELVPGEDSDKVRFVIKVQKLACRARGQRCYHGDRLTCTNDASKFSSSSASGCQRRIQSRSRRPGSRSRQHQDAWSV